MLSRGRSSALRLSVLERPVERVVGDFLPSIDRGQQMRAVELDDLRYRLRLVVLHVRVPHLRREEVILLAGDEEQRRPRVVVIVDVGVVLPGVDVRERASPEDPARGWDVVALVELE